MQFIDKTGAIYEVIFGTPIHYQSDIWEVLVRFPDWHENVLIQVHAASMEGARAEAEAWTRENLDFHVALRRPGPAMGETTL